MTGLDAKARVRALVVLLAAITIMATDYVRMLTVASKHTQILQAEIEAVPPVPGTERAGVTRSSKSRFAAVRTRYDGPVTAPQAFDHYRRILAATGWRSCGESEISHTYCRGDDEAVVSVPSSNGPGSYSLTLQWDRITWPVWLIAVALIFAAATSAGILLGNRRDPEPRDRERIRLRSPLPVSACLMRLEAAGAAGMTLRGGNTTNAGVTFGLQKRGSRFTRRMVAPYFHGRLEPDPATSGATLSGRFGLAPEARISLVLLAIMILIVFVFALYAPPGSVEGAVWVTVLPAAGLLLQWWAGRKQRREILRFLTATVSAD